VPGWRDGQWYGLPVVDSVLQRYSERARWWAEMATRTSTVPAVLDALKALLGARAGLDGVTVTTAPSGDPIPTESIQFFGTGGDQAWDAIGNRRRKETYTIRGGIFIQRRGAGPDVWDAARERAYAILAELEDAIRVLPTLDLAIG
jgi:hypothetical protein